ncbi:hypothetical protein [Lacipirellula limnantheis]|uniref:Uncharacterized protein n=1 Tax=Lacipirellula limnantheis TaxID=2528024 RepID=A0A517U6Q0_9BACT|nr:hypothetical protein [Lacipirellula limnantheis]QDT76307.1 hypothetical protein I41_55570 [Lacipirellula limnantheis]
MKFDSAISALLAQVSNSGPDQWSDAFFGLEAGDRFPLLIIVIGCVTGVVITLACIISAAISNAHQRRLEIELKREMLDRGMSADEVAKVIEASIPDDATKRINAFFGRKR